MGDFVTQTPYLGSALDPAGELRPPEPQSSFMSPNNPLRSTPLGTAHDSCLTWRFRKSPSDREKMV